MTPQDAAALIARCRAAGAQLRATDGRLQASGTLPDALRAELARHKAAVVDALEREALAEVADPPIDPAIATNIARRHRLPDIRARLARLEARAAQTDATPLDRTLASDWRQILTAKEALPAGDEYLWPDNTTPRPATERPACQQCGQPLIALASVAAGKCWPCRHTGDPLANEPDPWETTPNATEDDQWSA